MDTADLRDLVEFEEGRVVQRTVFETERLWAQLLCIDRGRSYGPASDPEADAVMTVVAGEAAIQVDRARKRLKQWGAVLVPAGAQVVVTNASPEPLVVLMTASPPPTPRPLSG